MSAVVTQLDGTLLEHKALALGVSAPSVAKLLAAEGFGKRASAATVQVALGLDSTAASEPTMEELVVRDIAKG